MSYQRNTAPSKPVKKLICGAGPLRGEVGVVGESSHF